jgi:hypothetical protein
MRALMPGAGDIDPLAESWRRRRPPLRPVDRASHRHREQTISDPAAPAATAGRTALCSPRELTSRPAPRARADVAMPLLTSSFSLSALVVGLIGSALFSEPCLVRSFDIVFGMAFDFRFRTLRQALLLAFRDMVFATDRSDIYAGRRQL